MRRTITTADAVQRVVPPRGTIVLEAAAVGVTVDGARLLHGVELTASTSEIHALIGPNGAGKSTLLAVLAGDLEPTSGAVTVEGRSLSQWRVKELSRRRAVMPQETAVFFPFSVRHVVEMGRAPWAATPFEDQDEEAVAEAIAIADIAHLSERQVPSLSGGERARTAFARVMAQRTGILLMDEPTAALDIHHQERVLVSLRERAAAGDAVVVVLHDLSLAAAYADRVTLLRDGGIVASGAPRDVLTAERLSEVYRHPIDVFDHPSDGALVIQPFRSRHGIGKEST